jgi:hypothetical protein
MQRALTNLRTSLQSVRDIAADIDANAGVALRQPDVMARYHTVLCAVTVILSGFLESFIREVAEEMILEMCSRAVPFANLPATIRTTHYMEGGRWLQKVAKAEKHEDPVTHAKAADGVRRLASVVSGTAPYEIVWEAFTDTQANPGPSEISAFLKRFDVDEPLPTLAREVNTTQNTLSLRLRSFIEIRNECAHTGSSRNIPTTTDVQGYCDLLDQLGDGVVKVFVSRLGRPPYPQPPSTSVTGNVTP